jgi:hypothetical protein
MEGAYELAVQHGRAGYYAVVRLEVKLVSFFQGARVSYADPATPWKAAAEFGVGYAYERTQRAGPKTQGAEVRVREIGWQPVDTTELLVALAAAHAFCRAVGKVPPPTLRLDPATGEVVFPTRW